MDTDVEPDADRWRRVWQRFDAIYCINLYTRDDRYRQMQALFRRFHIDNVQFHRVHRHANGAQGCFESHRDVMRHSLESGHKRILIFEDDCVVDRIVSVAEMETVHEFLDARENSHEPCHLFYLGANPSIWNSKIEMVATNGEICKLHATQTHAYIATLPLLRDMAYAEFANVAIDCLYRDSPYAFALCRAMFVQDESESDVTTWNNGLPIVQTSRKRWVAFTVWYAYYVNVPLLWIVVGLLSILLLFLLCFAMWSTPPETKNSLFPRTLTTRRPIDAHLSVS